MRRLAIIILLSLPFPLLAKEGAPRVALSSTIVIKVSDREKTADTLIDAAEEMGGYFTVRSDDLVTLKVPSARGQALIDEALPMGKVVERSFQAQDMGASLDEKRTLLQSRQEVLQRYFAVLNNATPDTVVEVEAEMTSLVQAIEELKGSIRFIEHQLEYASITVRFEFRERRPPARDGSSSFPWLNTMNLADLFGEFSHDR